MTISVDPSNMPKVLELAHEHALMSGPRLACTRTKLSISMMPAPNLCTPMPRTIKRVAIGNPIILRTQPARGAALPLRATGNRHRPKPARGYPHPRRRCRLRAILKDYALKWPKKACLHSFTSGLELAQLAIDLGFCLGINGIVTLARPKTRDIVRAVPLTHLLLETDAPSYAAALSWCGKQPQIPAFYC